MTQVLDSDFKIATGSLGWHSRTPMLHEAALLARVNHDPDALAYILRCIDFVARFKPEREREHLLHSHAQIAIAADMVRSQLPVDAHNTLCTFMREVAIPFNDPDPASLGPLGNNIRWVKSTQTAICALLWGEASQATHWQQTVDQGIRHTRGYLRYGQDEQGHSYEGTGYGQSVLRFMFSFVELLRLTQYADLYQSEPALHAAADATIHSMLPDQTFLTNDNDHGLLAASSVAYLLLTHNAYKNPNHLAAWYAYQGSGHPIRPWGDQQPWLARQVNDQDHKGELIKPEDDASLFLACLYWNANASYPAMQAIDLPTTQIAQGSGKLNVRTSWSKDAVFVQVIGSGRSPMSQTHRHADAGHFSLFAHGDYLAIDTGRYNSDEDQHSVVLVDNQCHAPVAPGWGMDHHAGCLEGFSQQQPLTYVRADMAHIKGCYWAKRHFLAIDYSTATRPDQLYVVTIDDINKDNELHDWTWQLQGHPDAAFAIHTPDALLASDRPDAQLIAKRARLDLHFLSTQAQNALAQGPWSLTQDVKEWQWPYGKNTAPNALDNAGLLLTSVRRPRLLATLHEQRGVLLAVVSPRRIHETPLKVTRSHTASMMSIVIELGDFTDTLLASPSTGYIDTPGLSAFTELLWYRKDRKGSVLQQWTLGGEPIAWKRVPNRAPNGG